MPTAQLVTRRPKRPLTKEETACEQKYRDTITALKDALLVSIIQLEADGRVVNPNYRALTD